MFSDHLGATQVIIFFRIRSLFEDVADDYMPDSDNRSALYHADRRGSWEPVNIQFQNGFLRILPRQWRSQSDIFVLLLQSFKTLFKTICY